MSKAYFHTGATKNRPCHWRKKRDHIMQWQDCSTRLRTKLVEVALFVALDESRGVQSPFWHFLFRIPGEETYESLGYFLSIDHFGMSRSRPQKGNADVFAQLKRCSPQPHVSKPFQLIVDISFCDTLNTNVIPELNISIVFSK